ncbi:MAG TPA: hypothetical protein VF598_08705, partial [Hymenobacter sp.]
MLWITCVGAGGGGGQGASDGTASIAGAGGAGGGTAAIFRCMVPVILLPSILYVTAGLGGRGGYGGLGSEDGGASLVTVVPSVA